MSEAPTNLTSERAARPTVDAQSAVGRYPPQSAETARTPSNIDDRVYSSRDRRNPSGVKGPSLALLLGITISTAALLGCLVQLALF
jgi:hypothetical protein